MNTLTLNPTTVVDQSTGGSLRLRSGLGWSRGRFEVEQPAEALITAIIDACPQPDRDALVARVIEDSQAAPDDAADTVDFLIAEQILVPSGSMEPVEDLLSTWTDRGWRTPAAHHLAGFGMPFMPDDQGGADYGAIYDEMLADDTVVEQPPTVKGPPAGTIREITIDQASPLPPDVPVQAVLERAKQVYAFDAHELRFNEVHGILAATFSNQRYQDSGLGPAAMRSYPSGGSRHPLEVYLVSRDSRDQPAGVYYFDPDTGSLHGIRDDDSAAATIDEACFLKRGVRSADYAVLISVRWLRHIWKYRYARSYKMVLIEVGHALQSLSFAATTAGAEAYYCPSYNDSVVNGLCGLDDPFIESVAEVMTLGRNGLTLEAYRERYETNA